MSNFKKEDPSRGRLGTLAWIITLIGCAVILLMILSHFLKQNPQAPIIVRNDPADRARITIGDSCVIDSGQGLTAVARNPSDFEDWYKAKRVRDEYGMKELIFSGRIFAVKDQSTILIIDSSPTLYKIRVLDGEKEGKAGWIPIEHARKYPRQ